MLASVLEVPEDQSSIGVIRRAATLDHCGEHRLTDDPDAADVILFPECHLIPDWRLRPILESSLVKRYPEKSFVYDERDHPWCSLPGVYVSMPRSRFQAGYQRAWSYHHIEEPYLAVLDCPGPRTSNPTSSSVSPLPIHIPAGYPSSDFATERALIQEVRDFVFFDPDSPWLRDGAGLSSRKHCTDRSSCCVHAAEVPHRFDCTRRWLLAECLS